jgi:hypothetical protein
LDKIQFLVEKTSAIYLNASSLQNTWFLSFCAKLKGVKESTLGR